jgi:hypothetical protein
MRRAFNYLLVIVLIIFSFNDSIIAQYCIPDPLYGAVYDTYIDSVRLGDIKYHDGSTPKDTSYNDLTQIDEYDELVPVNIFNNNGSGTFSLNSTFLGAVSPALFTDY